MALKKCKECGKEVSSKAANCPSCGVPIQRKRGCLSTIALIFVALFVVGIIASLLNSPSGTSTTPEAVPAKPAVRPPPISASPTVPPAKPAVPPMAIRTPPGTAPTPPLVVDEIATLSGTKYQRVTITRVEPDCISISHSDGIAKIPFTDLSQELRTKYGYDPEKAAQFQSAIQAATAKQQAAASAAVASAAKARIASGIKTTVSGYFASPSQELLEKAVSYAAQNDTAALQKLMASELIIQLKGGLDVHIVDTKVFSGLVKIRPSGQTIELWTVTEAVK